MTRKGQMKDCEWSNIELEAPRPQGHSLWENIGRSHTGQQLQLPLSRPATPGPSTGISVSQLPSSFQISPSWFP